MGNSFTKNASDQPNTPYFFLLIFLTLYGMQQKNGSYHTLRAISSCDATQPVCVLQSSLSAVIRLHPVRNTMVSRLQQISRGRALVEIKRSPLTPFLSYRDVFISHNTCDRRVWCHSPGTNHLWPQTSTPPRNWPDGTVKCC